MRGLQPTSAPRRLVAAAALMLSVALVAQTVWLPEQRDALTTLEDQTQRAQRQWRLLAAERGADVDARTPVEAFRARFPAGADNARRSAALLALGRRHGLATTRADFAHGADPVLGMGRYRVTLPLQGNYRALRSFVSEALASDPALLLDSVSMRRSDERSATVEAQLQFVLLSRVADNTKPGLRP